MSDVTNQTKVSKKRLFVFSCLGLLVIAFLWINRLTMLIPNVLSKSSYPILEIMMTSVTLSLILSLFKQNKLVRYLALIVAIPLLPAIIVAILSQTKFLSRLTLPMMVFPLVATIIYYLFQLLEYLRLGISFDEKVIPYLVLTVTMIIFAYFDKLLISFVARMIPESQMPQIVKDWTFELLDKKIFVKFAYLLITLLTILATIEKLYGSVIFDVLAPYKLVAIESLVTFVAIDRFIGKWKL